MNDLKDILSAFSEELRLRITILLRDSSLCVKCMVRVFDKPQPTVSRHLNILRKAGIVKTKRKAIHIYYTLNSEDPLGLLKQRLLAVYYDLQNIEPFKMDQARLEELKSECDAECQVNISRKE